MLKLTALAGTMAVAISMLAAPTTASAQERTKMAVKAKVFPSKAGTKRRPQGVKLLVVARWRHPEGSERPVIQSALTWFPRGSLYNGGKYPRCSKRKLNRRGPSGCPKRSIMGRAVGVAWADEVRTKPRVVIVNGGPRRVWLYTTLYHPALVQEPVPMIVRKARGRWAYKTRIVVPQALQVVAGVPISLVAFRARAGRGRWLATTGCPRSRRWRFKVRTFFNVGKPATAFNAVRCRR